MRVRDGIYMIAAVALLQVVLPARSDAAASSADTAQARAMALRDGWPDTVVGIMASGWVRAFAAGDSAMQAFLEVNVSAAQMEERSMSERMRSYRSLRKRYGDLMLHSIVKSEPYELTVVLLAEDASRNHFVFNVAEDAPHDLVRVGIFQPHGHGGHSGKGS